MTITNATQPTTAAATDVRSRRDAVIDAHVAAECRHDVEATVATFDYAHYDVVPLGGETDGADAVRDLLGVLFAAFPDFGATETTRHHADDAVVSEITMHGTHLGPWAGVPASGRSIDVRACCVFHFEDDRLVSESVYFDHAALLAQIGI